MLTLNDYEITTEGNVINKHTGHVLAPQPNSKGYLRVNLGGQAYFVHRLVAQKYVPNPENKEQVNHKDGNKLNNSANNLEWVSNLENRAHALEHNLHLQGEKCSWAKLTEENVRYIRTHPEISNQEYAELFNVTPSTIKAVKNYKSWKHIKI